MTNLANEYCPKCGNQSLTQSYYKSEFYCLTCSYGDSLNILNSNINTINKLLKINPLNSLPNNKKISDLIKYVEQSTQLDEFNKVASDSLFMHRKAINLFYHHRAYNIKYNDKNREERLNKIFYRNFYTNYYDHKEMFELNKEEIRPNSVFLEIISNKIAQQLNLDKINDDVLKTQILSNLHKFVDYFYNKTNYLSINYDNFFIFIKKNHKDSLLSTFIK